MPLLARREATAVAPAQSSCGSGYNFTYEQSSQGYDRYGNMTCIINSNTNGPCPTYSFSPANNRITNTGYTYDAAGDLTSDGTNVYTWNAESRLSNANGDGFIYNALGQRVEGGAGSSGSQSEFLYGPSGHILGVYGVTNGSGGWGEQNVWLGNRLLAFEMDQSYFVHRNAEGSSTITTVYSGAPVFDDEFYPFGQPWAGSANPYEQYYAGFPRYDADLGLDPASFRDYNPRLGRWLTPDLLGGDITNPQSLNRYAYALNNPITLTDPSGLSCQDPTDGQPCVITVTAQAPPPIPPSQYPGCVAYGTEGCIQPPCGELPGVVGCGGIIYTTSYGASGGGSAHHIGFGILDTPMNLVPPGSQPNNGEPALACELANIAAVNAVSNLNVSVNNVVGEPFVFNGGLNVNFSVPGASPSSLHPGRYPSSLFDRILGIGSSLHVPGPGGADPSTYGIDPATGNFTFTTHIDTAYATWHTPVGVLIHLFVDVRDNGAHRTQCGGAE